MRPYPGPLLNRVLIEHQIREAWRSLRNADLDGRTATVHDLQDKIDKLLEQLPMAAPPDTAEQTS